MGNPHRRVVTRRPEEIVVQNVVQFRRGAVWLKGGAVFCGGFTGTGGLTELAHNRFRLGGHIV